MILTVTMNAAIDKRYVVERFGVSEVNRVRECTCTAGGKGLNVARNIMLFGEQVSATGFVGGHAGAYITESLTAQGIDNDFLSVPGESRSCINIYDESGRTQTEFLEPGITVCPADAERFLEKYETLVQKAEVVTISGSVPAGMETDYYKKLIAIAARHGRPALLDTSGELLMEGVKAGPAMIKPNIDEIRQLTGSEITDELSLARVAAQVHGQGVGIVVISLGGDGSLVACDEGVLRVRVPKLETVNTVGCGDSMTAGFAIGLKRGLSVRETVRLASAISAANALRQETGYFLTEDMERLLPQIEIETINLDLKKEDTGI